MLVMRSARPKVHGMGFEWAPWMALSLETWMEQSLETEMALKLVAVFYLVALSIG